MSQLVCENILAAIYRKDFRAAKRNLSKLLSKKPNSLFPMLASVYIEFESEKIDLDQLESEITRILRKTVDLDANGILLLKSLVLNNFDNSTIMDYDTSIKMWSLLVERFPCNTSILEILYLFYADSLNFNGAQKIGEKLKNLNFHKYSFHELVSSFDELLLEKKNELATIALGDKIKELIRTIISNKLNQISLMMTMEELQFIHRSCVKFELRSESEAVLNVIKNIGNDEFLYQECKLKQLKFEMTYKDPKEVFQQGLLLTYKWYSELGCYKFLNKAFIKCSSDEKTFLEIKKKLEMLIFNLTQKYPLNIQNRAVYLYKMQFIDTMLSHEFSNSLSKEDKESATAELESAFVEILNFMKDIQSFSCATDTLYYVQKYPSLEKYVRLQEKPTYNEITTIALLQYRAFEHKDHNDLNPEKLLASLKNSSNAQLALFHLRISKTENNSTNILGALSLWSDTMNPLFKDRRLALSACMLSFYIGWTKPNYSLLEECKIRHHLRHTLLYGVSKSLVQNGDTVGVDKLEKSFRNEYIFLNTDIEGSIRQCISAHNYNALYDMLRVVSELKRCYVYQYLRIESTFQTMLALNNTTEFEEMFEKCHDLVFETLCDNRDFAHLSEFRKYQVTPSIRDETFKEDCIWMKFRMGLMSFVVGIKKRKECGDNSELSTSMIKAGISYLDQVGTLIKYSNKYQKQLNTTVGSRAQAELLDEINCVQFLKQTIFECEGELFSKSIDHQQKIYFIVGETKREFPVVLTADDVIKNVDDAVSKYRESFVTESCLLSLNNLSVLTIILMDVLKYCSLLYEYMSDSTSSNETIICVKIKSILSRFSCLYKKTLKIITDAIDSVLLKPMDQIFPNFENQKHGERKFNIFVKILKDSKEKIGTAANTFTDLYSNQEIN